MTELVVVTIVAERVLEGRITDLVLELGSTGYTVTDTRGAGSRNIGSPTLEAGNVRIETVVDRSTAERILDAVAERYFPHYGVIAYAQEARVVRGEKYTR